MCWQTGGMGLHAQRNMDMGFLAAWRELMKFLIIFSSGEMGILAKYFDSSRALLGVRNVSSPRFNNYRLSLQ
jgi:hypothetical protein